MSDVSVDSVIVAYRTWAKAEARRAAAQDDFNRFERAHFAEIDGQARDVASYERAALVNDRVAEVQWAAVGALYRTGPTSLAGAILVLKTMLDSDDGTCSHPEIPTAVANVVELLRSL